ncbi:MAG TPA: hypothetical protein VGG13_03195 [Candidatus Saccharimonadales bacterium]
MILVLQVPAIASAQQTSEDLNSIIGNTPFYDPDAEDCSSSSSSAAPGTGPADGAAFPNLDPTSMANAINTWIKQQNPNSELGGLGTTIVAGGQHSNVSPFLMVTIAKEESSLSDPSDFNVSHGNNSFGREAGPGQPSFQGARAWYKWSSVKASVNYTAPENKNAKGGGDIATYLRDEYGSKIDGNNLVALMEAYAPPTENNTKQYIANLKKWISQLVSLANGSGSTSGTSSGSSDDTCTTAAVANCTGGQATDDAAILCDAEQYNGIYYQWAGGHVPYATFRRQCPLSQLVPNSKGVTPAAAASTPEDTGPCATDCSGLVTVALNQAAGHTDYAMSVASDGSLESGGTTNVLPLWKKIPVSHAQPGDVVTLADSTGHIEVVVQVGKSSIETFGSHETGKRTSEVSVSMPISYWLYAWHWTGPIAGGGGGLAE